MSYQLQKHLLLASDSENYLDALHEWFLESDKMPHEEGLCICGRKIKNIYYARNVRNKNMIMLGTTCVKEIQASNGNFIFRAVKITQLFQKGFYKDLNIPEYCRQVFHDYLFSVNLDIQALPQLWQDYPLYRDIINNRIQQKMHIFSMEELEAMPPLFKQEYKDVIDKQIIELICRISTFEELEALSPLFKQEYKDAIDKRTIELICRISTLKELEALSSLFKQEYRDVIDKRTIELICNISTLNKLEALSSLFKQEYKDAIDKRTIELICRISTLKELEALSSLFKQEYRDVIDKRTIELICNISTLNKLEALSSLFKQEYKDAIDKRTIELICRISTLKELEALSPLFKQEYRDVIDKQKSAIHEKMSIQNPKNVYRALSNMQPICKQCNIAKLRYSLPMPDEPFHLHILNVICPNCKPIYEKFLSRYQKIDTKKKRF